MMNYNKDYTFQIVFICERLKEKHFFGSHLFSENVDCSFENLPTQQYLYRLNAILKGSKN